MDIRVDNRIRLKLDEHELDLVEVIRDDLTVETKTFITIRGRKRSTKRTYRLARGRGPRARRSMKLAPRARAGGGAESGSREGVAERGEALSSAP